MRKGIKALVERKNESKRLTDFLSNSEGGSVLLAGDRGSGKTTLVEAVVADSYNKNAPSLFRKLFWHNQIVLRIPLILQYLKTKDGEKSTEEEQYRSLLLRTIARSMESELLARRFSSLDLPMRWFRSIGYVQTVRGLSPLVNSTSLAKSLVGSGSLRGFANVSRSMQQNIDISDAVIEMKLRDIFATYSKSNSIIIIIDELDKLEDANFQPEGVVKLLKNLFSDTGVYVIFISNEPTINRVQQKIKQEPFCAEHTLFKDMILLNHLQPAELAEVIEQETKDLSKNDKRQAIAALSLATQLMPFNVAMLRQKLSIRGKNILPKLRRELGEFRYLYESTMQLFINHLYTEYSKNHDQYHNRVLYKALVEAGNDLFNCEVRYINWEDIESLFYSSEIYTDSQQELSSKTDENYTNIKAPSIIQDLSSLNNDEKKNILKAVEELVAIISRAGYLDMAFVSEASTILEIKQFVGDTFTVENIETDISNYLFPSDKELEIIDELNIIDRPYKILSGKSIFSNLLYIPVYEANYNHESIRAFDEKNYHRIIAPIWQFIESRLDEVDDVIMTKLCNTIEQKFSAAYAQNYPYLRLTTSIDARNLNVELTLGAKKYLVHFAYRTRSLQIASDVEKVFVLYSGSRAPFNSNNPRGVRRQVNCRRYWLNLEDELKNIADYIYQDRS